MLSGCFELHAIAAALYPFSIVPGAQVAEAGAIALKSALETAEPEAGKDVVISVTVSGFPIIKGTDATHAACGNCGAVLAWNVSPETIGSIFTTVHRIMARCDCGHHNLISARSHLAARLQSAFQVPVDEGFDGLLNQL